MGRKIVIILFFTFISAVVIMLGAQHAVHLTLLPIAKKMNISIPYATPEMWHRLLTEPGKIEMPDTVHALILPHHLITAPELTKIYRSTAEKIHPDTIILIGPNHYQAGKENVQSCLCTYTTSAGVVNSNESLITTLAKENVLSITSEPYVKEHSMYGHTPFIASFFPKAYIVPIILKLETTDEEIVRLVEAVHKNAKGEVLVISSVDFSHYIPELAADFHDQTSWKNIHNFDYDGIKNNEVDSPASLLFVTKWAALEGYKKTDLLLHTNSQNFFRQQRLEVTTSHLFIAFSKGEMKRDKSISMHFFGDTIFDRGIKQVFGSGTILKELEGQESRFFWGNDFQILNLEGPVTTSTKAQNKQVVFKFDEAIFPFLTQYHFNALNLANNHIFDYFKEGSDDTRKVVEAQGLIAFGDYEAGENSCTRTIKNEQKISFCGFNDVGGVLNSETTVQLIQEEKKVNNLVIVNAHWGEEYSSILTERQKDLAHKMIQAGADAIIGHHPHVIQPMEIYKGVPIIYSLGNFIFDQDNPVETQTGLSVGMVFSKEKILLYLLPFHTGNGKPAQFTNAERSKFFKEYLNTIANTAQKLEGKFEIKRIDL